MLQRELIITIDVWYVSLQIKNREYNNLYSLF